MITYYPLSSEAEVMALPEPKHVTLGITEIVVRTGADCPPVEIPQSVTMRQARLALLQSGMLAQVNTAVSAMAGVEGDAARIEWEFSSEVHRDRPFVASLSASLGLTSAQLDALFTLAATL